MHKQINQTHYYLMIIFNENNSTIFVVVVFDNTHNFSKSKSEIFFTFTFLCFICNDLTFTICTHLTQNHPSIEISMATANK